MRTHYVERDAKILKLNQSGLTTAQIAERLGIRAGTVRNVLYELRKSGNAATPKK